MHKYSRQREKIRTYVAGRRDHPTAEMIYAALKEEDPRLSLGTVYRNLSVLAEQGDLKRIAAQGGPDRYDGNCDEHYHFVCRKCGRISDIDMPVNRSLNERVQKYVKGVIESSAAFFYGTCDECRQAEKENR